MIIRPVAMNDLDELRQIAIESGAGFTSLVDDPDFLVDKIRRSVASFASDIRVPGHQSYLFVLADADTGAIMGTTGIEASVGILRPLFHYRAQPDLPGRGNSQQTLTLCRHYTGCSEICTLFLRPRFRRAWAGKLLSRVRFLFMAQHPRRFAETVIAQMRGMSDQQGESPFWRWLQTHFVDLDFATVNRMVGTGDNGFVTQLMPQQPLTARSMDESARSVIGEVHPDTRPALHMLECEGFRYAGLVDPFDAGPTVEARVQDLQSVQYSGHCPVRVADTSQNMRAPWTNGGQSRTLLVGNGKTSDFRATVTRAARYLPAHHTLELPAALAQTLGLKDSAEVWFADLEAPGNQNPMCTASSSHRLPAEQEAFHAR